MHAVLSLFYFYIHVLGPSYTLNHVAHAGMLFDLHAALTSLRVCVLVGQSRAGVRVPADLAAARASRFRLGARAELAGDACLLALANSLRCDPAELVREARTLDKHSC